MSHFVLHFYISNVYLAYPPINIRIFKDLNPTETLDIRCKERNSSKTRFKDKSPVFRSLY